MFCFVVGLDLFDGPRMQDILPKDSEGYMCSWT